MSRTKATRPRARAAVVAAALAVTTLAGCMHLAAPKISVQALRLGGLSFTGGTLYVDVLLQNPNTFLLRAGSVSYDIEVRTSQNGREAWIPLARGKYAQAVQVAAQDSTRVEIPVRFGYQALGGAVQQVLQSGSLEYRISGAVALEKPIPRSIPYRQAGTLDMANRD